MIASAADRIDDEIQQRFGGQIYTSAPPADEEPQRDEEPSMGMYL